MVRWCSRNWQNWGWPMLRSSPLRRTPITRATKIKRSRPKPAVPAEVRQLLVARSQGFCEARLHGCLGAGTDTHHRITQKAGGRKGEAAGRHNQLANCLDVCRVCHSWITDRPAEAYDLGLSLREWQVPVVEPVAYMDTGWVLLDNSGGLWPVGDAA